MNGEITPQPVEIPFAQAIAYATPIEHRRPGLVTAIGVLSIVLGSFGLLYNALATLQYAGFYMMSRISTNLQTTATASSTIVATTQPGSVATGASPVVAPINPTTFVAALDAQSGNALTPAVKTKLTAMLASPTQTHAPPGTSPTLVTATVDTTGNATFIFPNGDIVTISANGSTTTTNNFSTATGTMFQLDPGLVSGAIAAAAACMLVAIYLVVIGIMTVRSSRHGRRLHWIYVWIKVPLAVLAAMTGYWVYIDLFDNVSKSSAATTVTMPTGVAIMFAVVMTLGVAYPISLMIALRAKTVRAFYDPVLPNG